MSLTTIDGILALVPNTEGSVVVPSTTFQEVHDFLTENRSFKYKWDDKNGWVFIKEPVGFEDWIVVSSMLDIKSVSVSWGHW